MCGVAGFSLSERTNQVDTDGLVRSLLLGIEHRGRDATGIAWHDGNDSQVWIQKDGQKASQFVQHIEMTAPRAVIAHTRAATKGSWKLNVNNHPVEHEGIVGVHNGVIWNDDEVFDLLGAKRLGQVDSEAAFALLAYHRDLADEYHEVLPLLEGSAALAWINVEDEPGTLHLARVASSPLIVAQTRMGSLLFASTKQAIAQAAKAGGFRIRYVNELPEGSYLRVKHGRITDVRRFELPKRISTYGRYTRGAAAVTPAAAPAGNTKARELTYTSLSAEDRFDYEQWWNDTMLRGLV